MPWVSPGNDVAPPTRQVHNRGVADAPMTSSEEHVGGRLPRPRQRSTVAAPRQASRPRRVGLIVHSLAADPGRIVATAQRVSEGLGARLLVEFTSLSEPGRSQTRRLISQGVDDLVIAGGDGTVRQAVGQLVGGAVPLGIVPVGSGNVLGAALGVSPGRLGEQIRVAITGRLVDIDVGEVVCTESTGRRSQPEVFCCMAGIGRDAQTVQSTSRVLKKMLGPLAYGVAGLGQVLRPPRQMSWRVGEEAWQVGRHWTVLATNTPLVPGARLVPGGVVLDKDARMDDGLLDVVAVAPHRPEEWLGIVAKGLFGSRAQAPGLRYAQGATIEVHSPTPLAVQADGDIVSVDCVDLRARIAGQMSVRVS